MVTNKTYCLDTNIFIEGWTKYWSMDLSPSYWEILDNLALKGLVYSPIEVKTEISVSDDDLADWVKTRPHLFINPTEEIQTNLRRIMAEYPRLVDDTRQRSLADPWVIATAMSKNAIVVTKEEPTPPNANRIKIPDVCDEIGVQWMNDFQFAREIGIKFNAKLSQQE